MQNIFYGNLDSQIINLLKNGPVKITQLVVLLSLDNQDITKQAVYAAIRKLKLSEVVITHNMQASLSLRWIQKLEEFTDTVKKSYDLGKGNMGSYFELKNKERIEYYFSDLANTDAFWWQALYVLVESSRSHEPVYLYNPHDWFLIAHRESELASKNAIEKRGKQYLMTSGGNTTLDKSIAMHFDGNKSQYYMAPGLFSLKNYYFNIVDDFLIEVWLPAKLSNLIDNYYSHTLQIDEAVAVGLKKLISIKGRSKLIISKNIQKTNKYKKILQKHFYVRPSV